MHFCKLRDREMKLNQEENQTKQFHRPGQALEAGPFVLIFPVTIIHSILSQNKKGN